MVKRVGPAVCCVTLLAAFSATAEDREISFDVYGDWRAIVTEVQGGQETWRVCRAVTGGDGYPVLEINARQYDAGPPDFYPHVTLHEHAPRGYDTLMKDGDSVTFGFDDGDSYPATATAGFDEEGFRTAQASPAQQAMLYVLQGMRRAGQLDITAPGGVAYTASLRGFTAAYGKIAEACEFSTMGVITPLAEGLSEGGYASGDSGDDGTLLFEEHGAWRIQAEEFDNGGGAMVRECFASVPADTTRRISFGVNSLELAPPDSYPPVTLSEAVPETVTPMAKPGAVIQFAFDTGFVAPGEVMTDVVQEGARFVDLVVKPGYRDIVLREMRRGAQLWVFVDNQVIYQTSLDGFSASYADMARVCEFTTKGILD